MNLRSCFSIINIHEPSVIIYEDENIKVNLGVADLRDPCWLIGGGNAYNKSKKITFVLNIKQKLLVYRRVSYDLKQELYNEKTGVINSIDYNPLSDDLINVLELQ